MTVACFDLVYFNPRSPWGERLLRIYCVFLSREFQSTLPVGGATVGSKYVIGRLSISIHAPRGGSDKKAGRRTFFFGISIHAPRGGSDKRHRHTSKESLDFNPRSPWGERPDASSLTGAISVISIHAPRGGSDSQMTSSRNTRISFQSTLPVGGATDFLLLAAQTLGISIHAPRGGSDNRKREAGQRWVISIHAPRGGSDRGTACGPWRISNFNPRSPWGERLQTFAYCSRYILISIHAPRGGSDVHRRRSACDGAYFNPRSPWGERPYADWLC